MRNSLLCLAILALASLVTTIRLSAQTVLGVTPQGTAAVPNVEIGNSGNIQFQNNSSFAISVRFTTSSGAVFSNIGNLAAGQTSSSQAPQQLNVTVNYVIINLSNGHVQGPYGLEVGSGPLAINIANGLTDLDIVSVPAGGQIQFNSDDYYGLACTPANEISPELTSLVPGSNPVRTLSAESVGCTFSSAANGRNHNVNHHMSMIVF